MGGVLENVIPLSKLIGLLFLFCLPLLSILFLKTKRNDLARTVMGTIFLVTRVRVEHVIVKARQRGNYAANSPSPRALARGRGLLQHNFRGNPPL